MLIWNGSSFPDLYHYLPLYNKCSQFQTVSCKPTDLILVYKHSHNKHSLKYFNFGGKLCLVISIYPLYEMSLNFDKNKKIQCYSNSVHPLKKRSQKRNKKVAKVFILSSFTFTSESENYQLKFRLKRLLCLFTNDRR